MNRRAQRQPLDRAQCQALEHAWVQAAKDSHPLNAMVTIRPGGELSPIEHAQLVAKFWNRLGVWSRRITKSAGPRRAPEGSGASGPSFHCVLVREAAPNGDRKRYGLGEHFHALVHVPAGQLSSLAEAVARWHPADDVQVKPAHQGASRTRTDKIKSAIGYLTKQRTPQAWWNTPYRRQPGGIVLGKRYRISASLRPPILKTSALRPRLPTPNDAKATARSRYGRP